MTTLITGETHYLPRQSSLHPPSSFIGEEVAFWIEKGSHPKAQSWDGGQEPETHVHVPSPGTEPFPRGSWLPGESVLSSNAGGPVCHKSTFLLPSFLPQLTCPAW